MADRADRRRLNVDRIPDTAARLDFPCIVQPYLLARVSYPVYHGPAPREVPEVRLVNEVDVVRHPVDAHPVDGAPSGVEAAELLDLRDATADRLVAGHAKTNCRYGGRGPDRDVPVTERAVEPNLLNVNGMRKGYRLVRGASDPHDAENSQWQAEPGRDGKPDSYNCSDGHGETGEAKNS